MNKRKVPSIVIVVAVILIIGGLIFVLKYSKKESLLGIKIGKKSPKISEENLKDSDHDGLLDWEENLYKTDSNNPDTDKDGYLDGEEVNAGTNPLVKAPGDKTTFYPIPLGEKYNITKKILGEDTLSSIIDSYIYQKSQYINDHPEINSPETYSAFTEQSTLQEMSRRALAENYPAMLEKAQQTISEIPGLFKIEITDADIKISQDNSKKAVELYLLQLSSLLNSDAFFLQDQGSQALTSAFQDNNFSQLDKLISSNDEKIEIVKEIVVPSSWKENHEKRLKYIILIRNIFVSLRDFQNDPLKAYAAAQELENFTDKWNNLVQETVDLAKSQGIDIQK